MKTATAKVHEVRIPMNNGSTKGWGNNEWPDFKFLLLEIITDTGVTGWGEAWTYSGFDETYAALNNTVIPQVTDANLLNLCCGATVWIILGHFRNQDVLAPSTQPDLPCYPFQQPI